MSEFEFTDAPEQPESPKESATPYSNMGWEEYARTTLKNTPSSFWSALTALPKALYNYDETGRALYGVGSGVISKLSDVPLVATYDKSGKETRVVPSIREIANLPPRTAEEKAAVEAPAEQFGAALVEPFQSKEAALKTVAEDPFGVASTLSIPFTGGSTAALKGAELLGTTSKLGRGLEVAGKAAKGASTILDPTAAAIEAAKVSGKIAKATGQGAQSLTTGAPYGSFAKAFEAGYLNGPNGDKYKTDFMSYLKGQGSASDFAQSVNKAFDQLKEAESQKWFIEKGDALGLRTTPVDFNPIFNKFDELRNYYGGNSPTGVYAHSDAHAALDEAQNAVMAYATSAKAEDQTIVGLDKLKQRLYDLAEKQGDREAKNAIMGIWAATRNQLSQASPEYDALMTKFQNMQAELKEITKTLGAGKSNASQNSLLAQAIRAQKTPQKQQILDKLTEIDPSIAYKVAGATLHDMTPVGLPQKFLEVGSAIPWGSGVLNAFMTGQPLTATALLGGYGAQAIAQSPRAMAKIDYALGRGAGLTEPVVSGAAKTAKIAAPIAVTAEGAEKRKRPVFTFSDTPVLETNEQSNGGRVARKSGGRAVGNAISAEVKRVRALLSEKTASMLSVPDDAIATALHLAKRT